MRQKARVVAKDGTLVGLVVRPEACMSCRACEYGQKAETYIELPRGKYAEGDEIELELARGRLTTASLLAYGIPLAGLLIGLAAGHWAAIPEVWQAAAGIAGALFGFGALRLLEPRFRSFRPKAVPCMRDNDTPKGE